MELIDRAESLGTEIWKSVQRAEEHQLSILATIVGEAPAIVPENVGVFIVEDGAIAPVAVAA